MDGSEHDNWGPEINVRRLVVKKGENSMSRGLNLYIVVGRNGKMARKVNMEFVHGRIKL